MNLLRPHSHRLPTAFLAAATLACSAAAQPTLSAGHVDIGIAYEDGAWDLHVHKELPAPDEEFAPGDVILQVGDQARVPGGVPGNPAAIAFFGPAGSPLWVLPKTENPNLIFLGFGTEELSAGDWNGDLTLSLASVSGPGDFYAWDVGAFGDLVPLMSSRDGVGAGDAMTLAAGSHGHYFLGFSAPGDYEVSFTASGVHAVDGPLTSDPAGYRFQVVPEPGPLQLLLLGGAFVFLLRRQRHD